jgi:hypothetical protein
VTDAAVPSNSDYPRLVKCGIGEAWDIDYRGKRPLGHYESHGEAIRDYGRLIAVLVAEESK